MSEMSATLDELDWVFRERLESWASHHDLDLEEVLVDWGYASWWPCRRVTPINRAARFQ
jgi:hypothetical protein